VDDHKLERSEFAHTFSVGSFDEATPDLTVAAMKQIQRDLDRKVDADVTAALEQRDARIDFGDIYLNGEKLPGVTGVDVTFPEPGTSIKPFAPGSGSYTFTTTMKPSRGAWERLCNLIDGVKPHRSYRVTKRRKARADRERMRNWKRNLGSHLRWQRIAAYNAAVKRARTTGKRVETVTPSGIAVFVNPPERVMMLRSGPRDRFRVWAAPHAFPVEYTNADGKQVIVEGVETDDGVAVSQEVFDALRAVEQPDEFASVELLDGPPLWKPKLGDFPPPVLPDDDDQFRVSHYPYSVWRTW
jgi:hypothetical protein